MKNEKEIIEDIYFLFNETLNSNASISLKKILSTKLESKTCILNRNLIIQTFIKNNQIFNKYEYPLINHREVFLNLDQGTFRQILSFINPKSELRKNKKLFQELKGKTIQLILFFDLYYTKFIKPFKTENLPKEYKKEFNEFKLYFETFYKKNYIHLIERKHFGLDETLEVIKIINQNYLDKKQIFFTDFFSEYEAYISISKKALKNDLSFSKIDKHILMLEDFFHPKIENSIKNSFTNSNGVILLTGANMSGKSTFFRALGICVYLAHIGLPIPAKNATIPYYNHIYLYIDNNDNLEKGYSFFMQEILNLKEVVLKNHQNETTFALFDELFKGTNTSDALDILQTTLKGLLKFENSFFMISTHIHEIKEIIDQNKKINCYHLECKLLNNEPQFNYKIKKGFSDLKIGRILFDNQNLNELLKQPNP